MLIWLVACTHPAVVATDVADTDTRPDTDVEDTHAGPVRTDTEDSDTTDADTGPCPYTFVPYPADSAAGVFGGTAIEADYDELDATASLTVVGTTGTTEVRAGHVLVYHPDEPLSPNSSYTARLTGACGEQEWTFSTSDVGDPVEVDLAGRVYSGNVANGRWLAPDGMGDLLAQYLTMTPLFAIRGVTAHHLTGIVAVAADGSNPPGQDLCSPTTGVAVAAWDDPYFELGPMDLQVDIQGYALVVQNAHFSGAFSPDGSSLQGVSLSASLDTRPLVPLLQDGGADDAICTLSHSIGVDCVACPDGSGTFCLQLEVEDVEGESIPGATVVVQTQDDVCANPECASSACP